MRNLFSWRLRPSNADFTKLWENATFVFDTNFLLDLYRVSRSTSEDFLRIIERLQDRIWLPYQVASEFLNRREEIIDSEATSFQKALSALAKWKDEQQSFNRLRGLLADAGRIVASEVAFLFDEQDTYLSAIDDVERRFREKVEELANSHSPLDSEEDYILENLLSLFDGKVGEPYDVASMGKLYQEGADRYSKEIPPGFKDAKEKEDERKYGDFILWKQILDFAKAESCSIIFVTGEKKEDWWIKKGGETVSPRLELRREFQEQVKQPFWMYRTQRFLELAKEKLTVEINPRSIEETNAIANAEFADEQAYENLRQVLEQAQTPTLNENLRQVLEQAQMPTLNENLRRMLEQFQTPTPTLNENLRRVLEQFQTPTPTLNENLRRVLEQFQTPAPTLNENLRRAFEQAQTPSSEVRHLANPEEEPHDKLSSLTRKENAEVKSPLNALEKKDSQPIHEGENQGQENASPITDESQEESTEASPKPKKRTSSRKDNENNPKKSK
jgi:predicted nucleic acid-binding protein